jgi:hypothetical protein
MLGDDIRARVRVLVKPPTAATAIPPSNVTCRNLACAPCDPPLGQDSAARKTIEHSRVFHRLVKWRTGSEGRISYLK